MTRTELWRNIWMALATIGTVVVVFFIVRSPGRVTAAPRDLSAPAETAQIVGPRLVSITPGSALDRQIEVRRVDARTVDTPLLTVTASVVAHFVQGGASPKDRWQFQNAEVSNAYADWQRAQNDVEFSTKQLDKTRELATVRVSHFTEVYERLKKLVDTGTETPRDLANAKADLLEAQIQAQKDTFDAESALNLALRNRAAGERALLQEGIEPLDLEGRTEVAIVVAQVPETKQAFVHAGAGCEARFYGVPDQTFRGRVTRVAPTLSPDRRTLRVIFELPDPDDRLKPGMFADVGLDTDPRQALLVPAVIHVGRNDYVFARSETGPWRVQDVELGEGVGAAVDVQRGLSAGEEVIAAGAILLKPFLVRAIEH